MSEGVLPLSLAPSSEGVTLSSELPTVSEEPLMEQATTPAKMSDEELRIRNFFIMITPGRYSKKLCPSLLGSLSTIGRPEESREEQAFPLNTWEKEMV